MLCYYQCKSFVLQFLEKMQLLYHKKAQEKGIYIIGSCGFDSVPCDMGVEYTTKSFSGDLNSVEGFLSIKAGPDVSNTMVCQAGEGFLFWPSSYTLGTNRDLEL